MGTVVFQSYQNTAHICAPANSYQPHIYRKPLPTTFTQKFFYNTAKMSEDHKGVHNLKNKEQFEEVMAVKDSLMVVDCFATWCGPCKVIAPQVVKFSEKFPNARFYKLDVDEASDVAGDLGIRAMPTFILFKNGT